MDRDPVAGRREFLIRLWRCVGLALGSSALGVAFWDRKGSSAKDRLSRAIEMPTFSVSNPAEKMAVVRGTNRASNVNAAVKALGGMAQFVAPGDKVLLKVNAAFATPPMLGATTHPEVVQQVVALCLAAGAAQIAVTDNPINDPASCFELSGIGPAAREAGAQIMLPNPGRFALFSLKGAKLIQNWPVLSAPLHWADKVIGLAPVKDHHRSGASMTIKNWYGLLGGRRNIFHQQIHTIITELAMMVQPTLVILDGTWSMMANGPTGGSLSDLKSTRTLIAGTDPVAVDAFGATLLGKSPKDLPHLMMAQNAGAGTVDYSSLNPIEVRI